MDTIFLIAAIATATGAGVDFFRAARSWARREAPREAMLHLLTGVAWLVAAMGSGSQSLPVMFIGATMVAFVTLAKMRRTQAA